MFATMGLLVGVDIHRRTNVVQVVDDASRVLKSRLGVANNRPGTVQLNTRLRTISVGVE